MNNRELYGFISPNDFRNHNKNKSRGLKDKVTDLKTAVERNVQDGDYLGIGGFGMDRISACSLHEIVRQKKKNLTMAGHTATHDGQILAAGGCIDKVDAAYVVGVELLGLSPNVRKLFQSEGIKVTEWTNATLAWRYKAAAMGLSFLPARTMLGTETLSFSKAKEFTCPFTDEKYILVPSCSPDVAVIHVHRADKYGNSQIDGISVSDYDLARASKRVIITTEEIIDNNLIRENSEKTIIPYYLVDAVVHVPYGSYPGNMPGKYYLDLEHLTKWIKLEKEPEEFKSFVKKHIHNASNWKEYLELCGGKEKLSSLRSLELKPQESTKDSGSRNQGSYNLTELMICTASKFLEDERTVVVGTGLPMLAAMLAQKTHAPNLQLMFEAGGIAPLLPTLPLSVGDSRTHHKSILATSMPEIMETCARGMVDYAFLGGAQIDKYGNLNSTMIGDDYNKPKVRLPGSGGANDLASLCWKTIIIMKMDKNKFVEELDFLTTPGFLQGGNSRTEAGLPPNTGPFKVITDYCILNFDTKTKEMQLESLHPGVSLDDILEKSSFQIKIPNEEIKETSTPSINDLGILRNEIDPMGLVISK